MRKHISHSIVGLYLPDIVKNIQINCNKKDEEWYESFKILYDKDYSDYEHCITCKFDLEKLYEFSLDLNFISKVIEEKYDDILCIFSPLEKAQIDIFADTSNISLPVDKILFIDKDNMNQIYLEEVVTSQLNVILLCGIEGIKNIFYRKINSEWIVNAEGSNFQKLLAHPLICNKNTISNHMWDIYKVIGIEAAREFLIEEFINVVSSDGTYINESHIKLLVDTMTFTGIITSISRYGMKREHTGALAKASFEESLDNFLRAAVYGEVEKTKGVSASIMCGKRSQIGTGLCDIIMETDDLPEESEEESEEYKTDSEDSNIDYEIGNY